MEKEKNYKKNLKDEANGNVKYCLRHYGKES